MVCLPDTQEEEKALRETAEETVERQEIPNLKRMKGKEQELQHAPGYGIGFLTGILAALACVLIFMLGWITAQRIEQRRSKTDTANLGAEILTDHSTLYKLEEIQNLIEQHYLNEVDGNTLTDYLFRGVAVGLEDDYSDYYSAEELRSVLDSARGEYRGIGVTLSEDMQTHEISVLEVYDNSPAGRAGLQSGDILLAIDGEDISGWGLSEVITIIKGNDSSFLMKVFRSESQEELEVELECDEVERSYVEFDLLEDNIGYIRLTEFTEKAVTQFEGAVQNLNEQGMQKLLVDVRNNPGGLLNSVLNILDGLLPEGLVVYTEDKNGERKEYLADKDRLVTCEIAVLVNGGSASASEIFAGAIQDYELGPVIGSQTYGKGVVQDTYTLSDGSAFKMTTQKYYTPKGQEIDGSGITPDFIIEEETAQTDVDAETAQGEDAMLQKALDILSNH